MGIEVPSDKGAVWWEDYLPREAQGAGGDGVLEVVSNQCWEAVSNSTGPAKL